MKDEDLFAKRRRREARESRIGSRRFIYVFQGGERSKRLRDLAISPLGTIQTVWRTDGGVQLYFEFEKVKTGWRLRKTSCSINIGDIVESGRLLTILESF